MVSLNRDWLAEKVLAGERISPDEALELYRFPLEELGALANARRDLAKAKSYDGRGREIVPTVYQNEPERAAAFSPPPPSNHVMDIRWLL